MEIWLKNKQNFQIIIMNIKNKMDLKLMKFVKQKMIII
jgi:hypothetical protein